MNREYHRWYSPSLQRDMELLVFGHAGARVLIFPTSQGRFFQWEDTGMVAALGNRYVGIEGPTEDSAWLIDRLTGSVYRCEAPARGKASCDVDIATGSIAARPKP